MTTPMALAYEERGSGPLLLFVHGFPLDRTMWIPQLAGLAKHRTCVAADLRGHGLSVDENPGDPSIDLYADDLAATMDEMGIAQADLCGLSMGGYVVMAFWRRHRARVRSMTFIDTKVEADSAEGKAGRDGAAELVRTGGVEPLYAKLRTVMFGPALTEDVEKTAASIILNCPPEAAIADCIAMRDRPDSTPDLAGYDVPVLWCHGKDDALMPVDAARATAAQIKGSTFVEIENAGHLASMENPDAVNAAMKAFLTA